MALLLSHSVQGCRASICVKLSRWFSWKKKVVGTLLTENKEGSQIVMNAVGKLDGSWGKARIGAEHNHPIEQHAFSCGFLFFWERNWAWKQGGWASLQYIVTGSSVVMFACFSLFIFPNFVVNFDSVSSPSCSCARWHVGLLSLVFWSNRMGLLEQFARFFLTYHTMINVVRWDLWMELRGDRYLPSARESMWILQTSFGNTETDSLCSHLCCLWKHFFLF